MSRSSPPDRSTPSHAPHQAGGEAQVIVFPLRGDHIALDALLKATGLASSGGMAKMQIAEGRARVDGRDELRKTCKIRAGQTVSFNGVQVRVTGPAL